MKTRRGKGTGAEESVQSEIQDKSLEIGDAIPADIDLIQLQQILPDVALTKPAADDVFALFRLILSQRKDIESSQVLIEESRSQAVKKEIELDQVLQEHEVRFRELDEQINHKSTEITKLKQENSNLTQIRSNLENERSSLNSSQSTSATEMETLKHTISDKERENRDLIGVIARLRQEDEQRDEEFKQLRQDLSAVRKERQDIQSLLGESRSAETTTKYKLQAFEQQLELLRSTSDSMTEELNRKSEEFSKFRKEKHSELVNLAASLETVSAEHSAKQTSLEALQRSYSNQSRQLTENLQKISELEARIADQTASYRSEASNQAKLIELLESRNDQARLRLEEVENEWERMVKAAEEREIRLVSAVDKEKARADRLESILDGLHGGGESVREDYAAVMHGALGAASGDGSVRSRMEFNLSPAANAASKLQKSGKSFTEVYDDYIRILDELSKSQTERRRLEELLSQVLADLEERTPLLAQQRKDFERTKQEADQLANQLAEVISERDVMKFRVIDVEKQLKSSNLLISELEQSSADMGRQVQQLLRQIAIIDDPSLESVSMLPPADSDVLSADLALGSDQVVLFQNLPSLQTQNQMLLKIAHNSAVALDVKEREFREALEKESCEALREANEALAVLEEQLEDESKSHQIKLSALVKELEFYRQSRSHGNRPSNHEIAVLQNLSEPTNHDSSSNELQSHFDAYRYETEVDSSRLRAETNKLQNEINQVNSQLAKANGTIQFLNERHRMQVETSKMRDRELQNLNSRCENMRNECTRLELGFNQASEASAQAQALLERSRNEIAGLRAERDIWKAVEDRLVSENKALARERSQLADLLAGVQKMHDDFDRTNEHDRRRQTGQIQTLEGQLQDIKSQLTQERESSRHIAMRRDVELRELREKLDISTKEVATTNRALAVAETTLKNLQEKFNEVSKQWEGAKEKLSVLERLQPATVTQHSGAASTGDREKSLEIAQLSANLKTAQIELAQARGHVEQYRGISESNEQAFQDLTATFEQLQSDSQAQLASKEVELQNAAELISNLEREIVASSSKLAEFEKSIEAERLASKREQQALEGRIVELSTVAANLQSDSTTRSTEIDELQRRAQAAEQKYEGEIKAHASAINATDNLKEQLSAAQTNNRDYQRMAETAESTLRTSETSWSNQRALFEKEMADVTKRCQELTGQNELLHHQLESLSTQAARIRQVARDAPEQDFSGAEDQQFHDLHSIISYLRKEKEILELQLEVSKQDAARYKSESEHTSRILEETRKLLTEERERAAEASTTAAEHAELMERINQINVLRESNATLRAEGKDYKDRLSYIESDHAALSKEIEPLKRQILVLESESRAKEEQIQQARKEAEHWQNRNHQILSKYDKVDPDEIRQLKENLTLEETKVSELNERCQNAEKAAADQVVNVENFKKSVKAHREALSRAQTRMKSLRDELDQTKQTLEAETNTLKSERDILLSRIEGELCPELTRLREELQSVQTSNLALKQGSEKEVREEMQNQNQAVIDITSERDSLLAEKHLLEAKLVAAASQPLSESYETAEEKARLIKEKEDAENQLTEAKRSQTLAEEQTSQLSARVQMLLLEVETFKEKAEALEKSQLGPQENIASSNTSADAMETAVIDAREKAVAEIRTELSALHKQELESLEERLKAAFEKEALDRSNSHSTETSELTTRLTSATDELDSLRKEVVSLREEKETTRQQAMEQGRTEASTKIKLKDQQITKMSKKIQDLEQQLMLASNGEHTLQNAKSTLTEGSNPMTQNLTGPPASVNTVTSASDAGPSTATSRGRGVIVRGAATRGRGSARGTSKAVPATDSTPTADTTILGAATKRGRESDNDTLQEASTKRPKSGPVPINRNRPLPSESSSTS